MANFTGPFGKALVQYNSSRPDEPFQCLFSKAENSTSPMGAAALTHHSNIRTAFAYARLATGTGTGQEDDPMYVIQGEKS